MKDRSRQKRHRFIPIYSGVRKSARKDGGQVLVLWAVVMVGVLGIAGLAVNVGTVYYAKGKLQSAVDAAALAGAQIASKTPSGQQPNLAPAKSLIAQDAPNTIPTSTDVQQNSTTPSLIDANATQSVSGGFAALFGFRTFTVRAHAAAQYGPGMAFNYAVFSGKAGGDLPIAGGDTVNGSVHSNGTITISGGVTITGGVNAVGVVNTPSYERPQFTIQENQPSLSMPQWNVPSSPPQPQLPAAPAVPAPGNSLYVNSGANVPSKWGQAYNQNIYVTNGGSANLAGGNAVNGEIYVDQRGGVSLGSQVNVSGPIYVTGGGSVQLSSSDTANQGIYVSGGGTVTVGGTSDSVNGNVVVTGGGNAVIRGNVTGSVYVTGGGSVTVGGGVTIGGGIYVTGGGSVNVGGGDTVGALPSSAFTNTSYSGEKVSIMNYGAFGVTGASITVAGGDSMGGDVIDVGSFINITGGDNVGGNVFATQGNGSSNCYVNYGGGGNVTGYVIDQGGYVDLGGSTQSGSTAPGLTVADFQYKGLGGSGIKIAGGATFQGVLYAPSGPISLSSNPVYGAVVAQSVTLGGGSTVTYDASVVDQVPFQTISLVQ